MSEIKQFEPKFMPIGVLTAALQELTPRERRDPDPDLAIEEWLDFAVDARRRLHRAVRGIAPVARRRACRSDARPRRQHARPARAVRRRAGQACARGHRRNRRRDRRHRLLRRHVARGPGDPAQEARLHDRRHGRRRAARRAGGDGLRRAQPVQVDGPEPDRLRGELRAAAQRGQGPRPAVPGRAVPDAGLDAWRQLPQQHRLRARDVDRAAPDRRAQRRRRSVPHPLRPVARNPDGPGHPLDLPVPQGRRLRLPHRRHARQRAR